MISVRIVCVDYYMSYPIAELDALYSEFRGHEIKQVPVLQIFGTTHTGKKTCLHIHGVLPYLYIPYDGTQPAGKLSYEIAAELDKALNISIGQATSNTQHVNKVVLVSGIPFYGFHEKEHQFLKIYFYNPVMLKKACSLLENGVILNKQYQPHEAHINYVLQFMIDYNLHGMSFINLSHVKYRQDRTNPDVLDGIAPERILPGSIQKRSWSGLEMDGLACDILNKSTMELSTNPGLAALWEDERQRRRNNELDSQISACLTQEDKKVEPTTSHNVYKEKFLLRLSQEHKATQDGNLSVYPMETPDDMEVLSASVLQDTVIDTSVLDETVFDPDLNETELNLLDLLCDLRENADVDENSILSQKVKDTDLSDDELNLSLPPDVWEESFWNKCNIQQLDGTHDVSDSENTEASSEHSNSLQKRTPSYYYSVYSHGDKTTLTVKCLWYPFGSNKSIKPTSSRNICTRSSKTIPTNKLRVQVLSDYRVCTKKDSIVTWTFHKCDNYDVSVKVRDLNSRPFSRLTDSSEKSVSLSDVYLNDGKLNDSDELIDCVSVHSQNIQCDLSSSPDAWLFNEKLCNPVEDFNVSIGDDLDLNDLQITESCTEPLDQQANDDPISDLISQIHTNSNDEIFQPFLINELTKVFASDDSLEENDSRVSDVAKTSEDLDAIELAVSDVEVEKVCSAPEYNKIELINDSDEDNIVVIKSQIDVGEPSAKIIENVNSPIIVSNDLPESEVDLNRVETVGYESANRIIVICESNSTVSPVPGDTLMNGETQEINTDISPECLLCKGLESKKLDFEHLLQTQGISDPKFLEVVDIFKSFNDTVFDLETSDTENHNPCYHTKLSRLLKQKCNCPITVNVDKLNVCNRCKLSNIIQWLKQENGSLLGGVNDICSDTDSDTNVENLSEIKAGEIFGNDGDESDNSEYQHILTVNDDDYIVSSSTEILNSNADVNQNMSKNKGAPDVSRMNGLVCESTVYICDSNSDTSENFNLDTVAKGTDLIDIPSPISICSESNQPKVEPPKFSTLCQIPRHKLKDFNTPSFRREMFVEIPTKEILLCDSYLSTSAKEKLIRRKQKKRRKFTKTNKRVTCCVNENVPQKVKKRRRFRNNVNIISCPHEKYYISLDGQFDSSSSHDSHLDTTRKLRSHHSSEEVPRKQRAKPKRFKMAESTSTARCRKTLTVCEPVEQTSDSISQEALDTIVGSDTRITRASIQRIITESKPAEHKPDAKTESSSETILLSDAKLRNAYVRIPKLEIVPNETEKCKPLVRSTPVKDSGSSDDVLEMSDFEKRLERTPKKRKRKTVCSPKYKPLDVVIISPKKSQSREPIMKRARRSDHNEPTQLSQSEGEHPVIRSMLKTFNKSQIKPQTLGKFTSKPLPHCDIELPEKSLCVVSDVQNLTVIQEERSCSYRKLKLKRKARRWKREEEKFLEEIESAWQSKSVAGDLQRLKEDQFLAKLNSSVVKDLRLSNLTSPATVSDSMCDSDESSEVTLTSNKTDISIKSVKGKALVKTTMVLSASERYDFINNYYPIPCQSNGYNAPDTDTSSSIDLYETVRNISLFDLDETILSDGEDTVRCWKSQKLHSSNVYMPKYLPPTPSEIRATLSEYNIPELRHRPAYYSDYADVTRKVDVGHTVLKISSGTPRELDEFKSSIKFPGIEAWRKDKLNTLYPGQNIKRNIRVVLSDRSPCIITPGRAPPTRIEVERWIREQNELRGIVTPQKPNKPRLVIPASPGNDSDDCMTLSPCTPIESRDASPHKKNDLHRSLFSSDCSHQISGATLDNTQGFVMSLENLQDAKAVSECQYLTTLVVEVLAQTRGSLCPDPQLDPVRALFYAVQNDVPDGNAKLVIGAIVVDGQSKMLAGVDFEVTYVGTEKELFDSFEALVRRWDPDVCLGYEIEMQSWGYLFERAKAFEVNLPMQLSRVNVVVKHRQADDVKICGRILLDAWRLLRHEVALQSYTFENIMFHVLHRRVPLHSYKDLSFWWEHRTNLYRHITVDHFRTRLQGILQIFEQLDLIGRTSELARLFGIQFFEVLSRGSQFRVESLMLRLAKPLNYIPVSPSVRQRAKMRAPEWLPLILEPESRFYVDPVIVLDFQSLYPSIIIAYNYCFSTCIGRVEHSGQDVPFEFGATQLKISRRTLHKYRDRLTFSPCGVGYVTPDVRHGILPRMLQEILETRLMVKKSMKIHKDDKILQRVLHSRQLGLKLIANVTYGYTAANFSGRMPCVEVADSVVSKGRETLERAIHLIEESPQWRARVVYGDTDSLFVLVPGRDRQEAFRIGAEIADAVTAANPNPVKLKLEKVYQPCVLQTKKRYVGYMYESPEQKTPEYNAKGIETVRRDGCPAVSKMLEKCLKILFDTKDVSLVKRYVLRQFDKLLTGRASIQDLTFAKEYRGASGYKPGACVPALELAKKWKQTDKRREPRSGERVPYVIVNGPPGLPLIRLVRSPDELFADTSLRPNALYYITRVIIPPINRCFTLIGADLHTWFNEMPRKQIQALPSAVPSTNKKSTISQYFATTSCAVCSNQTRNGICESCACKPQLAHCTLQNKIQKWERTYAEVNQICQSCCGRSENTACISLDCPVLYRLNQTQADLKQVAFVRNLLTQIFD